MPLALVINERNGALQSNESGGHGASASTSFCFTPEVAAALAQRTAASGAPPVPLIATGGVMTGRQVLPDGKNCTRLLW